jgi:hypothetical protein
MTSLVVHSPVITHVHLRIGRLDYASVSQLRQLLHTCPSGPDVHLLVDLTQAGDEHDMTLFALLAGMARPLRAAGGTTTALRARSRLSNLLIAIGVTVSSRPVPQPQGTTRHLTTGAVSDVPSERQNPELASCLTCV